MTEIEPVKPFKAEAERATWPALPPGVSVKLAGLRLSEKSARRFNRKSQGDTVDECSWRARNRN